VHPAVGTILIALGAGACVTAASWWSAHATVAARLRANLGREAIAYARTATQEVDPDANDRALAARDQKGDDYARIEARMRELRDAWRAAGAPVRFVFTLAPDTGSRSGMAYVVDAEEPGPDKSGIGEPMKFSEREISAIDWSQPRAFAYVDSYGSFYSGFAPLMDASGRVRLVVGIDLDAASIDTEAASAATDVARPVGIACVAAASAVAWAAAARSRAERARRIREDADIASRERASAATLHGASSAIAQSAGRIESRLPARMAAGAELADRAGRGIGASLDALAAARRASDAARGASSDARAAVDCGTGALGEVSQIDAGVQAVIVRGRELVRHLDEMRRRAETVDAALEAMVQIANRSAVLSLNAEIEAAQAGEAGRGFAVVAGEIRRLAQQAAANSMEIERNVQALHAALEAGGGATEDFARAAEEASARSARLQGNMAEGIQRMASVMPALDAIAAQGDAAAEAAETAGAELRELRAGADAMAEFLSAVDVTLREMRSRCDAIADGGRAPA
jgi:methyl-accepting chemotaxis protein